MGFFDFFKNFFKINKKTAEKDAEERKGKDYVPWDASYSVNIKQIDEEHKILVDMLNELHNAMQIGKGKDALSTILDKMINYVGTHFAHEEEFMEKYSYPDYPAHKEQHKEFVKKAVEFQKSFKEGKLGLSVEVMFFLKDWTLNHIKGSDQKYGPFFNAKGLK